MEVEEEAEVTQTYIMDCTFAQNYLWKFGGIIMIRIQVRREPDVPGRTKRSKYRWHHHVTINNTVVSKNSLPEESASVYIHIRPEVAPNLDTIFSMAINYSLFKENKGGAVSVYNNELTSSIVVKIVITASYFQSNMAMDTLAGFQNTVNIGIVAVRTRFSDLATADLIIIDTEFVRNIGSSIVVSGSNLSLVGRVTFTNNTARTGAAILLDCKKTFLPTRMNLFPNSTVLITNNTALQYGGGIAVNPECYGNNFCFYYVPLASNSIVYMEDNSALMVGDSLYGPSADYCEPQPPDLFSISEGYWTSEVVLFEPYTICICTKDSITDKMYYKLEVSIQVRPGQEITLQASVCTRPFADIKAYAIQATVVTQQQTGHLGTRQAVQEVTEHCDTLTYSVLTTEDYAEVKLSHVMIQSTRPTILKLAVLPCPQGFQVDSSLKCDCINYFLSAVPGIKCNITTNLINVPAGVWIGNYTDGKLVAHQNCPLDYCYAQPHYIHLQKPDTQCTNNRSGVLCGACKTGLSLTLGTARCVDYCSNYYFFLIIPLALAGVLLVFLLLKCNLTVSTGSTNALIFYANIIHVNRTVFLTQNNTDLFSRFLAVFIAWVNLDLGIDTCFYKGMTAYANTWIQFVFPVYMWMLVFIIIYTSRYSITISKFVGRNAVSVLATLFLLSYAKLLRTVIAAISLISIHDESGNTHLVWLMDGNVPFLGVKHAALFAMALLTVLLYILPFTLLTLLAPLLQARTHHPLLRWVVRIKPLLDAYQGPYKDKYRYWTGVMLTMRLVLFTVFAANTLGDSNINLFSITLAITLYLLSQMYATHVLKSHLCLIIECFYCLNLSVYASATLLLKGKNKDSEHLTWVMVGSALAVFSFTITWHLYTYVSIIHDTLAKLNLLLKSYCRRRAEDGGRQECRCPVTSHPARQPAPTTRVIDMKDLREPLLTDN